jgi:hypothetical protein
VGYSVSPAPTLYVNNPYLQVTTYWQATAPLDPDYPTTSVGRPSDYHIEITLKSPDGSENLTENSPTTEWRPMATWGPDVTYAVTSGPIFITSALGSQVQIGARVLAGTEDDTLAPPLPAQAPASGALGTAPYVADQGTLGVFAREAIAK